ncbi:MAG: hypothetical protein M1821_006993 [Bathelium mastoideum]|nr:MAG: hypothetical protein M1821_006993 [Bathelium mastoideum]
MAGSKISSDRDMQHPHIALFGPQVTRWSWEELSDLQSALLENKRLDFLCKSLEQLPSLWPIFEESFRISSFDGESRLRELRDFASGKSIPDPKTLSNSGLALLTVVTHVVDFVRIAHSQDEDKKLLDFQAAQGFGIGFLSAAILASSSDWSEFKCNVTIALRLAAFTGLVVGVDNASHVPQD